MSDAVAGLAAAPVAGSGRYILAFSGGLDSTVLLHWLWRLGRPLLAVHVHHGMQPAADAWQAHCERLCREWGVAFRALSVIPETDAYGPEAGARRARYAALESVIDAQDVLVTAHHADDQAETFLQQALRGAGPKGLAGMAPVSAFGRGRLARPLLGVPREAILDYARAQGLDWLDDPSNRDPDIDRAYLRRHVWPALQRRWPQASLLLGRSAQWCAEAAALADEWAAIDRKSCAGAAPELLSVSSLLRLGPARRRNLLRFWLRERGLPAPDHRHLGEVERALHAAEDAQPLVHWPGAELRRHRDCLLACEPLPPVPADFEAVWDLRGVLALPAGCGRLEARPTAGVGLRRGEGPLSVRLRRGGERIRLPGRRHRSELKTLLQSAGMPVWVRRRLPLLYAGDALVAVADLCYAADYAAAPDAPALALRWLDPPPGAQLLRGRRGDIGTSA